VPTIIENDVPVVDSGGKVSIFNDYFVAQGRLPGADTLPPFVHLHPSAQEFFTISVEEEEIFRLKCKMLMLLRRVDVMVLEIE
jgi:hypothetical protein